MMKKTNHPMIILMLVLVYIISMTAHAAAGTSVTGNDQSRTFGEGEALERLIAAPAFKFWDLPEGIGYGKCPVYSAPSEDAFRAADGKALCDTKDGISEAGMDSSGWLLISYALSKGGRRVGYIPSTYVKGYESRMDFPQFDYIPVTAARKLYVTDNPFLQDSYYAVLDPDETFYVLGKYTYHGDWWYIECIVDGKKSRGFIDRESSPFFVDGIYLDGKSLSNPLLSPLGTRQSGVVRVDPMNYSKVNTRTKPDPNAEIVAAAYTNRDYPCYGQQEGSNGKTWYYIWIEEESAWVWISSGVSSFEKWIDVQQSGSL